jgi:hypothetical protein
MEKLIEAVAGALRVSCQQRFDRTWSHDTAEAFARAAIAAVEASGTHAVVPTEPTPAMYAAMAEAHNTTKPGTFDADWSAFLAARPKVTP